MVVGGDSSVTEEKSSLQSNITACDLFYSLHSSSFSAHCSILPKTHVVHMVPIFFCLGPTGREGVQLRLHGFLFSTNTSTLSMSHR